MDFMFDWDGEGDRFSFEDSDRFEEDSLCSWISEPESLCNNWRGWRKQTGPLSQSNRKDESQVTSLIELAAQAVAGNIPFEVVEHFYPPIPEQLQLRIAFWSFPENEEDIRLYSCLANGSADEFQKGEHLFKAKAVKEPLQIGFHLSATVVPPQTIAQTKGQFSVAIVFDRRRISSCNCTCTSSASWCAHVVALCLFRIHQAPNVCLRAPVSESLSRLQRDQLQKFAQYLISELPQQILPTAQRLLDELLSSQQTAINTVCGAPDPTAGPSASEQTAWCLDEMTLHENIKKTLIKFCVPSPTVFSDVTYLSSTAPPAASEWQSLLRPMRGREPEGMWNLLSIVREMYRRHDSNSIPLLEILTEEVLACEQILIWWFNTKISATHNASGGHSNRGGHNSNSSSQHAASSLCDEIVTLWRLAALNPSLSPIQRDDLSIQLKEWHVISIEKVRKGRSNTIAGAGGNANIKKNDVEIFTGFKAALEACQLDWGDYQIPGITFMDRSPLYWRFSFGRANDSTYGGGGGGKIGRTKNGGHATVSQVSGCAMKARPDGGLVLPGHPHLHKSQEKYYKKLSDFAVVVHHPATEACAHTDGSSSEGFCDTDRRGSKQDSDSDLGVDIGEGLPNPLASARTSGHNSHSSASRKCEQSSGSGSNTVVTSSNLSKSSRKLNQGGASHGGKSRNNNDDEGLPSEGRGPNLPSAAAAAAALNLPAHVKVMKSDDVDIEALVAAMTSGSSKRGEGHQGRNGVANGGIRGPSAVVRGAECGNEAQQEAGQQPYVEFQQHGIDEYQVYNYDYRAAANATAESSEANNNKKKKDEPNFFAGIKKVDNPQDILFARAEALHAHGHTKEACKLAKKLAEEMLANPPDLTMETPPTTGKGKKNKKNQNNISSFASSTLAKAAFLCTVLLEECEYHHLSFRIGLFGLEMPRPPASNRALEVKLAYQESELVNLLKKIPLGNQELNIIRDRAEKLRDCKLKSRGEALLPLMLATFLFESLCLPQPQYMPLCRNGVKGAPGIRLHTDEKLGFEACVAALGLKANISEAEHGLLCEGTRRQRGELAVAMIVHYKDDQVKLTKIMDKMLDRDVHQLFKAPSLSNYLPANSGVAMASQARGAQRGGVSGHHMTSQPEYLLQASHAITPHDHTASAGSTAVSSPSMTGVHAGLAMHPQQQQQMLQRKTPSSGCDSDDSMSLREVGGCRNALVSVNGCEEMPSQLGESDMLHAIGMWVDPSLTEEGRSLDYLNLEDKFSHLHLEPVPAVKPSRVGRHSSKDTDSSALEDENTSDYKAWEAKFRCTPLKTSKKKTEGLASIDSSAPETNSSDNSPTMVRKSWGVGGGAGKHQGPGSDSGSSGKSTDSFISSSSGDKVNGAKIRDDIDSPTAGLDATRYSNMLLSYSRSSTPSMKGIRYKGKTRIMPTVPNMPSEASAHFMFELAKTILNKAGGTSSTSLFTQSNPNNNPTMPHRHLHLCAFQIGLYALGLHNCVSPNWLSRTYSSHVSWITGQAMEIGSPAINILIETWEGHLTPQEVASLADRASRCRDASMVRAAAELALSCLPHAQALNPNEIQRALLQCKEQSRDMLERACVAVESAAKGGGVYPEVLFDVAKRWSELYEESAQRSRTTGTQASSARLSLHGNQSVHDVAEVSQALVVPSSESSQPQQQPQSSQQQPLQALPAEQAPVMQLVPAQQLPMVQAAGQAAAAAAIVQIPADSVSGAQQAQIPPGAMAIAAPIPYTLPPPVPTHTSMPHHPYIAPYSYVQQINHNFAHHYSAPHIPLHTHNIHPSYMASYPYQGQNAFTAANVSAAAAAAAHLQNAAATMYHAQVSHLRPPPPPPTVQVAYVNMPAAQLQNRRSGVGVLHQQKFQQVIGDPGAVVTQAAVLVPVQPGQQVAAAAAVVAASVQQIPGQQPQQAMGGGAGGGSHPAGGENPMGMNNTHMSYLQAAYRVGMLAMETLARRVHDDRPQTKYARSPPYGEDVKWLLAVAMKLGTHHLQQFCASAVNAIVSPFVLHDIALEAARFLARNNPTQIQQQLRSPALNSLMQKCLQMFIQCAHQRMHHIAVNDYDEFVTIVCSARNAFIMTPGGMVQFNELLQSLRRSKSCKKDLWQRIVNGLAAGTM